MNRKDSEYEEPWEEDELWEDEPPLRFRLWMIPATLGIFALVILICIPLWRWTVGDGGQGATTLVSESAAAPEATEMPKVSATPEITVAPDVSATPEATVAPEVSVTPEATATPEVAATPKATNVPESTVTAEPISGDVTMQFAPVDEVVTAKDVTNLRSAPSTADTENVVTQLKNGETVKRLGVNDATGWSKLEYNGENVYAVSQYLTTDLNYTPTATVTHNRVNTMDGRVIVFVDCDDYITPKEYVNLRSEPSTSEGAVTVRAQLHSGEAVHRTGYSPDSGWSRVEYNGEVLYVVSSYIIHAATE